MADWNFFTNHGHIIFLVATSPDATIREISDRIGITERATQRIISELLQEGYISITRVGRQNRYKVDLEKKFKHSLEQSCSIGDFIELLTKKHPPGPVAPLRNP